MVSTKNNMILYIRKDTNYFKRLLVELVKIRGSDIIGISIENRCKMITIEQLKALNKPGNTAITEHARIRLYERNINIDDYCKWN